MSGLDIESINVKFLFTKINEKNLPISVKTETRRER